MAPANRRPAGKGSARKSSSAGVQRNGSGTARRNGEVVRNRSSACRYPNADALHRQLSRVRTWHARRELCANGETPNQTNDTPGFPVRRSSPMRRASRCGKHLCASKRGARNRHHRGRSDQGSPFCVTVRQRTVSDIAGERSGVSGAGSDAGPICLGARHLHGCTPRPAMSCAGSPARRTRAPWPRVWSDQAISSPTGRAPRRPGTRHCGR